MDDRDCLGRKPFEEIGKTGRHPIFYHLKKMTNEDVQSINQLTPRMSKQVAFV
jgi:hypothetical protein